MIGEGLTLLALLQPSSIDARRGVVRLSPEILSALGVHAWSPLLLEGGRRTGALVAHAPPGSDPRVLYADELVLANLGVVSQTPVRVRRAVEAPALRVTVSGPPGVAAAVPPEVVRLALLGKVVTLGDQVSLLPQDVSVQPGATTAMLDEARRHLSVSVGPQWTSILLRVEDGPADPGIVSMGTVVAWSDGRQTTTSAAPLWRPPAAATASSAPSAAVSTPPAATPGALEPLPGQERETAALREWWGLGFHRTDLLAALGTSPSMGVLLSGPAGSGKVSMVRAVAASLGARVVHVWGPALAATEPNAAARRLREAIADASAGGAAVLLLEDVEALASLESGPLTSLLLEEVQGLIRAARVAVACTTAAPEAVNPALRLPGALDHELALGLPDRVQRRALLTVVCRPLPLAADVSLDEVAARTPGFVAADLQALAHEAATAAARRLAAGDPTGPPTVRAEDFTRALETVRPSAMGAAGPELGGITLDDVGDMVEVKRALTEAVLWPLSYPETFARMGISPPRGLLLYGPPGCGKTFLVRAVAAAGEVNVLAVKGAELLSRYVGDSEAGVRELFRRARAAAPSLVFLDELDALAPVRGQSTDGGVTDRVVASLLTELDGVDALRDVVVIGATNRPDMIDPALLRPGRLERLVYVAPPDADARADILRAAAAKVPLEPDIDLAALAVSLVGWSSADLAGLIREAALTAMRRSLSAMTVTAADLAAARGLLRPSLRAEQVAALAAFADGVRS